jgi:hypothetical protein
MALIDDINEIARRHVGISIVRAAKRRGWTFVGVAMSHEGKDGPVWCLQASEAKGGGCYWQTKDEIMPWLNWTDAADSELKKEKVKP